MFYARHREQDTFRNIIHRSKVIVAMSRERQEDKLYFFKKEYVKDVIRTYVSTEQVDVFIYKSKYSFSNYIMLFSFR